MLQNFGKEIKSLDQAVVDDCVDALAEDSSFIEGVLP